MKKNNLVEHMAICAGISKVSAQIALEAFLEATSKSLQNGNKVSLTGFGTWSVYERSARIGRNPKTNEPLAITAKNTVKFKASSQLLDKLQS
ncbi:MAG: HU family DNA-binding protein [Formosa sp.]|nr:HU family DNA-binding protein [Formosa sp.]